MIKHMLALLWRDFRALLIASAQFVLFIGAIFLASFAFVAVAGGIIYLFVKYTTVVLTIVCGIIVLFLLAVFASYLSDRMTIAKINHENEIMRTKQREKHAHQLSYPNNSDLRGTLAYSEKAQLSVLKSQGK